MTSRQYQEYGLTEWLRAHRVELGPAYAAISTLLLGGAVSGFLTAAQAAITVAALALGCAFWTVRAQGWRRPFYGIVSVTACAWVGSTYFYTSAQVWLWGVVILFAASVVLGIPWWSDHVRRTQVKMEGIIRTWSLRAERIRLKGTALTNVKTTAIGWSANLAWLPGAYTVEDVTRRRSEIEGALGLNSGELRIAPDGRSTKSVKLVAVTKDPHAAAIPWEIPCTEVNGQLVLKRSRARDPIELGVREDSTVKKLALWIEGWGARQLLGAGIKGSGKSNLFNRLWVWAALSTDVVQWGIDLKGGMELGPLRGVFDWVVYTREQAVLMMAAAEQVIDARAVYCREVLKKKVWPVTPETPLLVISIDEAASLLGDAKSSELHTVEELARKGRAVGVVILIATQYPTLEALGSSQIRQQIDQRFCFRMADGTGERYIVPEHTVDAHKIPADRPGTCYHLDGEKLDPMPFRAYFVEDTTIAQLVELLTGYTCPLDRVSATAAETVPMKVDGETTTVSTGYAEREVFVPIQRDTDGTDENAEVEGDGNASGTGTGTAENESEKVVTEFPDWDASGSVELDAITAARDAELSEAERDALERARATEEAEPARLDEAGAKAALIAAMRAAGPEGGKPRQFWTAATRGSSWFYDRMSELESEGKVSRTTTGRWAWIEEPAHSS